MARREVLTKEQQIEFLRSAIARLREAESKGEALQVLRDAGEKTGYKPAMRALVMAQPEENWIKW